MVVKKSDDLIIFITCVGACGAVLLTAGALIILFLLGIACIADAVWCAASCELV